MSTYSKSEQDAYDAGFKIAKTIKSTGIQFNKINKQKWSKAYRNQINELISENEKLIRFASLVEPYISHSHCHGNTELDKRLYQACINIRTVINCKRNTDIIEIQDPDPDPDPDPFRRPGLKWFGPHNPRNLNK